LRKGSGWGKLPQRDKRSAIVAQERLVDNPSGGNFSLDQKMAWGPAPNVRAASKTGLNRFLPRDFPALDVSLLMAGGSAIRSRTLFFILLFGRLFREFS
jgi:hypothetical protein